MFEIEPKTPDITEKTEKTNKQTKQGDFEIAIL